MKLLSHHQLESFYMVKFIGSQKKKGFLSRLKQTISRSGDDTEVAYQGSEYPHITEEMITPVDKSLSSKEAVSIYRRHMLAIGYLEKSEMNDFVDSLKKEIAEHGQFLKEEVTAAKEALGEAKAEARPEIKRIRKLQSKAKDKDEKADYIRDLEEAEAQIQSAQEELAAAREEFASFKKDKRQFLINYINSEVHGPSWDQRRTD